MARLFIVVAGRRGQRSTRGPDDRSGRRIGTMRRLPPPRRQRQSAESPGIRLADGRGRRAVCPAVEKLSTWEFRRGESRVLKPCLFESAPVRQDQ